MRISAKINWLRVLIPSAIVVVLVLVAFRYHYFLNNSQVYRIDALTGGFCRYPCTPEPTSPTMPSVQPTPTPESEAQYVASLPLREQLANEAAQRMAALESTMHMSDTNFGQRFSNSYFRLNGVIDQAAETADGLLFVVYSTCAQIGAGCERYHFGIVSGETVQEVWLPHKGRDWYGMDMLTSSVADTAVVRGECFCDRDESEEFEVTHRSIQRVPLTNTPPLDSAVPRNLVSGATCAIDTSPKTTTFLWTVSASGRKMPLISKAALLDATSDAIKLSDVETAYCSHFHNVDLLVASSGDARLIFVLAPGQFRLAGPGEPALVTHNHMLLEETDVDRDGNAIGWEYADMSPKTK